MLGYNLRVALGCNQPVGCIDTYWARFWLLSFADGFERRALLGSIVRQAVGDTISWQLLNAICASVAATALALAILWAIRAVPRLRLLFAAAILVGPPMSLLAETLGDPMQVALVVVGLCALLPGRFSVAASLVAIPAVLLIHEATAFLHVPVLVALAFARLGRSPGLLQVATPAALLALGALLFADQPNTVSTARILSATATAAPISVEGGILPGFVELLRQEMVANFGSVRAVVHTAKALVGAFAWPLILVACLAALRRDAVPLVAFAFLALLSLPLYLIAHDWGRFAIHSLFGALLLTQAGVTPHFGPFETPVNVATRRLHRWVKRNLTLETLVVALFLYEAHRAYRIDGLTTGNLVVLVGVMGLLLVAQRFRGRPALLSKTTRPADGTKVEAHDDLSE
jgi:hypothetical protein